MKETDCEEERKCSARVGRSTASDCGRVVCVRSEGS